MSLAKRILRVAAWYAGRLMPINPRKVVFCSYYGRGYSDNPKAIAQELLERSTDAQLVWLVRDQKEADTLPPGIRPCAYDSLQRVWELSTAKVWVDNCRKYDRFKKKGQFYLQTWHGFALKRIEQDAQAVLEEAYVQAARHDSALTDLVVSNSRHMTRLFQNSFWYAGEVGEFGTPRNDIFCTPQLELRSQILALWGLPENRRLLLYAPTFRADHGLDAYRIDLPRALEACEQRFGGSWSALVRLHPNVAAQSAGLFPYDGDRIIDVTAYPDMQELLCAVDLLITDYSSSMFDYALGRKPCLQFALDINSYTQDRNFYFPVDQLPFPLAASNEALIEKILSFDETAYLKNWDQFYQAQGFCENGHAAARCADWIISRLAGKDGSL